MSGRLHFWMTSLWSGCIGVGLALVASLLWDAEIAREAFTPPATVHETRLAGLADRTIWIDIRATRHRDCRLVATTQWQGADRIISSRINRNRTVLTPGEHRWIRLRSELPLDLAAGAYRVRSVGEYTCADGNVFAVPTAWVDVELK
ncbi:hypothetical protein [Minwuia sp.]|uniref:hypothetical protein n=1 Tax=Minwuia sp. TaxID=2493630 RepID=UPI003A8EF2D4